MAENKKSVLLYCDIIHTVEKLDDETAGKLFKHYLRYINDLHPETDDLLVEISFEPIKQNLKRDLVKLEARAERSRTNGQLGGRPKNLKEPKEPSGLNGNPTEPRKPVIVKDTVTVKETVKVNVKERDINIIDTYEKCIKHFPASLHPSTDKLKNNWYDTIEKLNRIEKIPFDWIVKITARARGDDFWSKNFLTLTKLRNKNKDGIKYIKVFYENFKQNGKQQTTKNGQPDYTSLKRKIAATLTGAQPE